MKLRPLEQQFEPETLEQIRTLQSDFESLPFQALAARYFTSELTSCLEAGLLLAGLLVGLSLLEFFFREFLIAVRVHRGDEKADGYGRPEAKLDRVRQNVEDASRLTIYDILDELVELEVVSEEDACQVKAFYRQVRIPLQHAIMGRFLLQSERERWGGIPFYEAAGVPSLVSLDRIEETIELDALAHLESIARFISKHCEDAEAE